MFRFLSIILAFSLSNSISFGSRPEHLYKPDKLRVRTTAYTHTEADHIQYGKKNAKGTKLRLDKNYHSAAADWSRFPVGTKFKMKGNDRIFVIDDYGSALVGTDTIDIYKLNKKAMWKWGVRHVDIEIIEHGCFDESAEILKHRTKFKHCRQMLAGIRKPNAKYFQQPKAPEVKDSLIPPPPIPGDEAQELMLASNESEKNEPETKEEEKKSALDNEKAPTQTVALAEADTEEKVQPEIEKEVVTVAAASESDSKKAGMRKFKPLSFDDLNQKFKSGESTDQDESGVLVASAASTSRPAKRARAFKPLPSDWSAN